MISVDGLDKFKVISFDIFDTVITRNYIDPKDIFYGMQEQLQERFDSFANHRIKAELECRREYNFNQEVSIEEIYSFLLKSQYIPNLKSEDIKDLIDMELTFEKDALFVNPEIKSIIEELRKRDKKVILISDIYLPKSFLKSILEKLDIPVEEEDVFISSELKFMKSNKKLFQYVLDILDVKPQELCHIGDNEISDVNNPKSLHIHAIHYKRVIPNRYEIQTSFESVKLSHLRGLSRKVRLNNPYRHNLHKATIWDTTANVSAPLMVGFTLWCLQKTQELGIEKIYFCSRDGEILYKIAKEMLPHLNSNLNIDYLYVSRQSLLFPSIKEINDESLEWIMAPTAVLTPNIILKRINLQPEEIYHILKKYDFHSKLNKHLSQPQKQIFRKMLKEIEPLIVSKANEYKKYTLGYLKERGLHTDRFALVDIGWSGTLQRSISQLLGEDGYRLPTYGLYFGVKRRKKFKDIDQLHGWFTDYRNPRKLDQKTYIIPMTELFTAALHGGVHSHIMKNNKFIPKLLKDKNEKGLKWGIDVQHETMLTYTRELVKMPHLLQEFSAEQELDFLEKNYEKFLLTPTYNEAETYGAYEDAEDQNESYYVKLAQRYTWIERLKMLKNKNYKHHHNEWKEGALKLTIGEEQ